MRKLSIVAPFRVLFFGNDDFSLASLKALSSSNSSLVEKLEVVVSRSSRSSPVKLFADKHGLAIHDWLHEISPNSYDVGIVVSFGHLIPKRTIEAFPWGILNVHGSILPRWRGSSPVVHSILHGDETTGVTVMQIKPKTFDTGDILLQDACTIPHNVTTPELTNTLANMGSSLLIQCLEKLDFYVKNSTKQDPKLITKAPKLISTMGKVEWSTATMCVIDRKFRALSHAVPLYTFWKGTKVKLLSIERLHDLGPQDLQNVSEDVRPGFACYHKHRKMVLIKCLDGWISVGSFMVSGKKTVSPADFQNGFLSKVDVKERHFEE